VSWLAAWRRNAGKRERGAPATDARSWQDARAQNDALIEYVRAHHWAGTFGNQLSSGEVLRLAHRLLEPGVGTPEKKFLLLQFAHADNEAALTALECFAPMATGGLRHFARYALLEARARRRPSKVARAVSSPPARRASSTTILRDAEGMARDVEDIPTIPIREPIAEGELGASRESRGHGSAVYSAIEDARR
jgi:hypothetical protein